MKNSPIEDRATMIEKLIKSFYILEVYKVKRGAGKVESPKIGVALGSGGARGFAHLGVIKALTENNIPIDFLAGSSMGALVGALYASGIELATLYKMALTFKRKYYLDFTVPKWDLLRATE